MKLCEQLGILASQEETVLGLSPHPLVCDRCFTSLSVLLGWELLEVPEYLVMFIFIFFS